MNAVMFAWLLEAGIIAYRDVRDKRTVEGLPPPGDFLATFVVFGGLAAIASSTRAAPLAGLMAGGLVIATALDVIDPTFVKPLSKGLAKNAGTIDQTSAKGA